MPHVIIGYGEPLVEVRTGEPPKGMVLDTLTKPGNLDIAVEELIEEPSVGFSGDILNATNAARHVLAGDDECNQTTLVTAVGDGSCNCSENFIAWLEENGIGSGDIHRVSQGHMGAYVEGYRDDLGSFPYARASAAFEVLTHHDVANVISRHDSNSVGLILTGITHARTRKLYSIGDILEVARQKHVLIFYAVNFRMSLWGTQNNESMQNASDGFKAIAEYLDFCSLGKEEAEIIFGDGIADTTQAKRYATESLLNLGIRGGVALTGYPYAYIAFWDDGRVRVINRMAQKTEFMGINTTGAGDNFTGAFAALYLISGDVQSSFEGSCRIAELSTTVQGGIYHPSRIEITGVLSGSHTCRDI